MRRFRLLALLCVTLGSIPSVSSAAAGLLVDAGATQRVAPDTPFSLEAHVEGASPGATIGWTAPAGCVLEEPNAVVTAATCSAPGPATFTVEVLDGTSSAADGVTMVVVNAYTSITTESGTVDVALPPAGGTPVEVPIEVPAGAVNLDVVLDWTSEAPADFDFTLRHPDGSDERVSNSLTGKPEDVTVEPLVEPGTWVVTVLPRVALDAGWTLTAEVSVREGDRSVPVIHAPSRWADVGDVVDLTAAVLGGTNPVSLAWETTPASYAFDDADGSSLSFTFSEPVAIKVKATDAAGLEAITSIPVRLGGSLPPRPFTVVGIIDFGFSPYHFDFVGSQHPWNLDADPDNDVDFTADPATYIEGHPGATPINLTLPAEPTETIEDRRLGSDAEAWSAFGISSSSQISMYWFPGTKIIGALKFEPEFYGTASSHGERSAASAGGNIHGTCPECLFVLIQGAPSTALAWASSQPWIDVISNSYGHCLSGCVVRDGVYTGAPTMATRAGAEAGSTIVFSAGNGIANAYDVPQLTYTSSEQGPDWIVTVGANSPDNNQNYLGSGKPADISSIGANYPSTGGTTATGTGTHSGTSNAGPVTAGTFAKVLQEARELLGDVTSGHDAGVVASGEPVPCGEAVPDCALGDGVLTRSELWGLVFGNVLPAPQQAGVQVIPTTPFAYYYQGHGALLGRLDGDADWNGEWTRMMANASGEIAAFERPAGERNWFTVDSKCRQRIWGSWSGGYFTGSEPALDPVVDPLATVFDAWCSQVPPNLLGPQ